MAEKREPKEWITVNGIHIPIYEGETKAQAINRHIIEKNEETKEKQIEANKKQADELSAKKKKPDEKDTKQKQLEIIQKYNPKDPKINKQATWIESVKDIRTWAEAMEDDDYNGEGVAPDFTWEDAKKAAASGYVTVYSSKPIEQGIFVTPSRMIAVSYGNKNPYSKRVKVDTVAWIDLSEGQFADVEKERRK